MRVLVDTNVMLDAIIGVQPYYDASDKIIKLCADSTIEGYMACHSIPNMYYILRKHRIDGERREILKSLCQIIKVEGFNTEMIVSALNRTEFSDFEDCLQDECAVAASVDYIVTRNIKDFGHSSVKAISPQDFLSVVMATPDSLN